MSMTESRLENDELNVSYQSDVSDQPTDVPRVEPDLDEQAKIDAFLQKEQRETYERRQRLGIGRTAMQDAEMKVEEAFHQYPFGKGTAGDPYRSENTEEMLDENGERKGWATVHKAHTKIPKI